MLKSLFFLVTLLVIGAFAIECDICWEEISPSTSRAITCLQPKCGKNFHLNCITNHFRRTSCPKCPLCRCEFQPKIRIFEGIIGQSPLAMTKKRALLRTVGKEEFKHVLNLQLEIPQLVKQIVLHQVCLIIFGFILFAFVLFHFKVGTFLVGLGEGYLLVRIAYYYGRLGWIERTLQKYVIGWK